MTFSKVLLTGMNGTVAPAIARSLADRGVDTVAWNRAEVPVDNPDTVASFVERTKPDRVVHAALGSPEWSELLARTCARRNIPFIFVSTVSVFAAPPNGPYGLAAAPNATDDYGRYKRDSEARVSAVNPDSAIVRIGWQIGTARGSNNMVDFLERQMDEKKRIEANRNWIPSCAFLEDTGAAFARLLDRPAPGLRHVEGNAGWTFAAIVHALNRRHGGRWTVEEVDGPTLDNRLADAVDDVGTLEERLRS